MSKGPRPLIVHLGDDSPQAPLNILDHVTVMIRESIYQATVEYRRDLSNMVWAWRINRIVEHQPTALSYFRIGQDDLDREYGTAKDALIDAVTLIIDRSDEIVTVEWGK